MKERSEYLRISIAGDLGSGKSTIARELRKRTGFEVHSTGDIQRVIASERNMSTLELNKYAENHPEIDHEVDRVTKNLGKEPKSLIIDSRMAWHFIPDSFKIYLQVNPVIAAKRILPDQTRPSEEYANLEDAVFDLGERKESEKKRFKALYDVDCSAMENYDIVVDTTLVSPSEIADVIILEFAKWKRGNPVHKFWISPKLMYPTQRIVALAGIKAKQIIDLMKRDGYDYSYPVDVVKYNRYLFIFDGHKRTSAALMNSISLIPIYIRAADNEEVIHGLTVSKFIETSLNLSWIYEWEDCHKFTFFEYPKR